MSNFVSIESFVVPQGIADTSTSQKVPLGMTVRAKDNATTAYGVGTFIYLKGVASTVLGSVVTYNADDMSTTLATANAIGPVATSMSINVASSFGWYQIHGKGVAKVLASFANNADTYLTATAGSVDDADVAGDSIRALKGASAIDTPSTGLAEVEMSYPFVDNGNAD